MVNLRLGRRRPARKAEARGRMPFHRRPMIGALVIGGFITICLGWLFSGIGKPVPLWGYPILFVIFVVY